MVEADPLGSLRGSEDSGPSGCVGERIEEEEHLRRKWDMRWMEAGLGIVLSFALVTDASAGAIAWSGTLVTVDIDSGIGRFRGGVPGTSVFSGSVQYPDTCGATCTIAPDPVPGPPSETGYRFSNGLGTVQGVGASAVTTTTRIDVVDEDVIDEGGVDFAALFGIDLVVGQTIDTWSVSNITPVGSDIVEWGISYVYITTDPLSSSTFRSTPPPNPDLILWQLIEDGDQYSVVGEVDSVPEPGMAAMLAAGLATLGGLGRRHRRRCGQDTHRSPSPRLPR